MFHPPQRFPLAARLEAHWAEIRDESEALAVRDFLPWLQADLYQGGWSVFPLFGPGHVFEANCARCPRTVALLRAAGSVVVASYSRLEPGASVRPHRGSFSSILRLHLALSGATEQSALRVGDETRAWQVGRAMIFDDLVEHEAWNRGAHARTVLMADFLRPFAFRRSALEFARDRLRWRRTMGDWYRTLVEAERGRAALGRAP